MKEVTKKFIISYKGKILAEPTITVVLEEEEYIKPFYAGEPTRTIPDFIHRLRLWKEEALKHRKVTYIESPSGLKRDEIYESEASVIIRIFNNDLTAETQDQIITSLEGTSSKFSYYNYFGKGTLPFINLSGFPLDVKHFMKNIWVGSVLGETIGLQVGIDEEFFQSIDPNAKEHGLTSAFSPEDLLSNSLGLIFSRYVNTGDFCDTLEAFLNEAFQLFKNPNWQGGTYISSKDIQKLKEVTEIYHGTSDLKKFYKGSSLYTDTNKGITYKQAAEKLKNRKVYKNYLLFTKHFVPLKIKEIKKFLK